MRQRVELEQRIVQLKLKKRDLVLAGRNTYQIDREINIIQQELNQQLESKKA